jgi:ribosomal protein S18 acetylase RimI-like enzyme
MVEIRRIEPGDGDVLRRIRLAALMDAPGAFSSTYAEESVRTDAQWSDRARAGAAGSDRATYLAFVSGEAVGLAAGFTSQPEPPTTVHLVGMWTAPRFRGKGIAAKLARAVLRWAQEGGAETMELWVTEGNAPAEQLYRSLGFAPTGDREPLRPAASAHVARMTRALT